MKPASFSSTVAVLLALAAPARAQEPDTNSSFKPIGSLTLAKAQKRLASMGFTCQPDPDPPMPGDLAFRCGNGSAPGQYYSAQIVGDKEGNLHVLSVMSHRPTQGGRYDLDAALKMLGGVASVEYAGSKAADVTKWLEAQIGGPLRAMTIPEKEIYDPQTGLPRPNDPLEIAGVVFTIVGFPSSPGFDMALKGY